MLDNKIHSCASKALKITTYYAGDNQPTHPNVITFPEPWHGYKYYMGYTPYPYANGSEENPCLAVSNDLLHWEKPRNLVNPIACAEEHECDELKDSHLLYRSDLDRLEMWYLGRNHSTMSENGLLHCFRKTSDDGINWSDAEIMYVFCDFNLASPTIIWNVDHYEFWGIRNDKSDINAYYMQSSDGITWSELIPCVIPDVEKTSMWHGTVSFIHNKYYFVWVGNSNSQRNVIYYAESKDKIEYTYPKRIINNDTGWNYLYRPCLVFENSNWYCYYGVVRFDGKWLIGVSSGKDLNSLVGCNISQSNDSELISITPKMKIKYHLGKAKTLFSIRALVILPVVLSIRMIFNINPITSLATAVVLSTLFSYFFIYKKTALYQGIFMGLLNSCIISFIVEMINFCK